jgi:hypothetical protein
MLRNLQYLFVFRHDGEFPPNSKYTSKGLEICIMGTGILLIGKIFFDIVPTFCCILNVVR